MTASLCVIHACKMQEINAYKQYSKAITSITKPSHGTAS